MAAPLEDPVAIEKVLAWRSRGISYKQIAVGMGIQEEEAKRLGQLAAEQAMLDVDDDDTLRALQLHRLELIEGRLIQWLDSQESGDRLIPRAVDQVLRIEETRDRILGRVRPSLRNQLSLEDLLVGEAPSEPQPEQPVPEPSDDPEQTPEPENVLPSVGPELSGREFEPVQISGFTNCGECGSLIGHKIGCGKINVPVMPSAAAVKTEPEEKVDQFAETVALAASVLDATVEEFEEEEVPKSKLPLVISSAEDALF